VFLILLIGFSRLYLGTNTLSSVVCGFAGGIVWLSTWLTVLEMIRLGKVGDRRRAKRAAQAKAESIARQA
jgi:membrane-associated phospholipid phosphatase